MIEARWIEAPDGRRLELLTAPAAEACGAPELLFLHGLSAGAWIWAERLMGGLAERGIASHAVSLRGHGASDGHAARERFGLKDYMADLNAAITALARPLALVGHSAGGMIAQTLMQRLARSEGRPLALALLASAPPSGLGPLNARLMLRDPAFFARMTAAIAGTAPVREILRTNRAMLFSEDAPDALVLACFERWRAESPRLFQDLTSQPLIFWLRRPIGPVLVMGFEQDRMIDHTAITETGWFYGVKSHTLPNAAHMAMLEPGWERIAEALAVWTRSLEAAR